MVANKIIDEFTDMPISRQRKYQLRKQRDNQCTECGEPTVGGVRCLKHLVASRERQRLRKGLRRRYYNTLSYKLESRALAISKPLTATLSLARLT